MKTSEIYRSVTDRIVAELKQGAVPWVKPWKVRHGAGSTGYLPYNAITGRSYSGINILTLWDASGRNGFDCPAWLTFNQAKASGGSVRKGEKGTHVVFTKRIEVENTAEDDPDHTKQISMLRAYVVFNIVQVEGLPEGHYTTPVVAPEQERLAAAEQFIGKLDVDIRLGGDRACYVPSHDQVHVPHLSAFDSPAHYYATVLHELGHWTGHKRRLDRDLSGRFGSRAYAAEELIAELTAAFLCASLGIKGSLRHAGYIASWLELLQNDDRAIFTAASKASQAAGFLSHFPEGKNSNGGEDPTSSSETHRTQHEACEP